MQVTISLDEPLRLTERERRRVSFQEPLDDDLRSALTDETRHVPLREIVFFLREHT